MIEIKFFDGYIRNLEELCLQLSIPTMSERKTKERSILINGYKKWGKELPLHLKGYFAFALLDVKKNCIFGARDRFGVIPFYYTKNQSEIYCDCYIRKVLHSSQIVKEVNVRALQLFMTFGFVPGTETFFQNVYKLMPGCRFIYKNSTICIDKYHYFHKNNFELSFSEYQEKLHYTLKENLGQMEELNGAFLLSSGIDSNYLYAMSNINKSFSIGFDDVSFDESMIAHNNAQLYKKNCERIILNPKEFFESVVEATTYMEQPIGSSSSIAFMNGCKYASSQVEVCYTGEGADELFAGYEIYKKSSFFSKGLTYLGKSHIFDESEKKILLKDYINGIEDIKIVNDLCPRHNIESNLKYMMNIDMQMWLEGDSFMNTFKMSRAFNLEIRMPFIDENLFELAYSMPDNYKIQEDINKYILRKSSEKVLPKEISYYKKRGFVTPIRQWMLDDRYNYYIKTMLDGEAISKFFIKEEVNRIYIDFLNGNHKLWRKIWLLYSFSKWYEINF